MHNNETEKLYAEAKQKFGEDVALSDRPTGEGSIVVQPARIKEFSQWLRDDLRYDFYSEVLATDFMFQSPRFDLTYTVWSTTKKDHVHYKAQLNEQNPQIDTISEVYPGANWHEREIFDLFGVDFVGHPDQRRILMPDYWNGYPLRKDYPVGGEEVQFSENFGDVTPQTLPSPEGEDVFLGWDRLETQTSSYTQLLDTGAELERAGEGRMIINMGPQHPSTHGVLRLLLE
ncbi:MAG: NADH-quinone oxidoreductase subunit C, partial [Armatimonadota bacterium]